MISAFTREPVDGGGGGERIPYASGGGFSMPTIGSTMPAPTPSAPAVTGAPLAPPRTGLGGIIDGFKAAAAQPAPAPATVGRTGLGGWMDSFLATVTPPASSPSPGPTFSVPTHSGAAGATPLPVNAPTLPMGNGTPTATGSGGTVPSTSPDYFHDILDLITAQLETGQASAQQQFSATPILLPSGGSYGGSGGGGGMSLGDDGSAVASAPRKWGGFVVLAILGGAAFYWFYWRKRGGAA